MEDNHYLFLCKECTWVVRESLLKVFLYKIREHIKEMHGESYLEGVKMDLGRAELSLKKLNVNINRKKGS